MGTGPTAIFEGRTIWSRDNDFGLTPYIDPRYTVICARAPLTIGPHAYAWYRINWTNQGPLYEPGAPEKSRAILETFIGEIIEAYNGDTSKLIVGGFSQGGAMTYSLLLTVPEKLSGAVIMSGRTIDEMKNKIAPDEAFHNIPVLVVHGTDDNVLPIDNGHKIRIELSRHPIDLTFQEFKMAHEINDKSLNLISRWLREQLDSAPAE